MSTTATLTPSTVPAASLILDGCDRCSAAGLTRYLLPSGLDLVLCGHHSVAYGLDLCAAQARPQGITR